MRRLLTLRICESFGSSALVQLTVSIPLSTSLHTSHFTTILLEIEVGDYVSKTSELVSSTDHDAMSKAKSGETVM